MVRRTTGEAFVERSLRLLKTLANAQRLRVLDALARGERSVAELRRVLPGLSPSALSQHLRLLRAARLVRSRRALHTVWYALEPEALDPLRHRLERMCPSAGRPRPRRRAASD